MGIREVLDKAVLRLVELTKGKRLVFLYSIFLVHNNSHASIISILCLCAARHRSATSRAASEQTKAVVLLVLEGKWVVQSI